MFKIGNKTIDITRDLTIGSGDDAITYPAASLSNPDLRASLGIIEVADQPRPDDRLYIVTPREDGGFDIEPRDMESLVGLKMGEANGICEGLLAQIKNPYPQGEVESWPKQEAEARAWLADNGAATPLLDSLCAARGIAKAELVTRIVAKSDLYAAAVGLMIGSRQAHEDAIDALKQTHDTAIENEDTAAALAVRETLIAMDMRAGWPDLGA